MAKARAIHKRIHAVRNTAKITNTMYLIAQARFKVTHDRAVAARPYTDQLGELLGHLTEAAGDFKHPLLEVREPKRAAVLAVASNRGLCGGYNSNVARKLLATHEELKAREIPYDLYVVGKKLVTWLEYMKIDVAGAHTHIGDKPTFEEVRAIGAPFLDNYLAGDVDEVIVVYTKFLSASRQEAVAERVLPLTRASEGEESAPSTGLGRDYIFSPDPATILSDLLPRRVLLHLFQAFLDAVVSEQNARMIAMRLATDNAYEVISELTRLYNRSRQAQITTELSEIMGGAEALK